MLDQLTIRGRLVAAALKLAAERPWREVTLANIAEAAGVSLVDVRREFNSKSDALTAFVRMVDDAVLARAPHRTGTQPARDALFEVIMSRFDVLAAYKPALKSIAASWTLDPSVACAVGQSQAWMLRAAGIRAEGLEGQARAAGLATVYASVYRTWLSDDDPGSAKTMAALDRHLRRGERVLQSIDDVTGKLCGAFKSCCETLSKRSKPSPQPAAGDADPAASVPPGALS
jgi:AcrR family transcriptional regulator